MSMKIAAQSTAIFFIFTKEKYAHIDSLLRHVRL
jgi:hypothetical protein